MPQAVQTDFGNKVHEFDATYPDIKVKDWFAKKNDVPTGEVAGIIKETAKAVFLAIATTDKQEGFVAVWVPKSCTEALPTMTED